MQSAGQRLRLSHVRGSVQSAYTEVCTWPGRYGPAGDAHAMALCTWKALHCSQRRSMQAGFRGVFNQPQTEGGTEWARTRVALHVPVAVSQMRARPSKELDTISVPSRWKSTAVTGSPCAGRSCVGP